MVLVKTMNQLIEDIKLCKFAELPKTFRSEYIKTSNERWATPQFMDKLSTSTVVVNQKDYINLSDFNFGILNEQDRTFQIHIKMKLPILENMLCQYLFNGNHNAFNKLVEEETENLMHVQKLLHSKLVNCVKSSMSELEYVQPLVTVMEADFIDRIHRDPAFTGVENVKLKAAQGFPLETKVTIDTNRRKGKSVKLGGKTDILIQNMNDVVLRIQELKACCKLNCLYKSCAWSCKSQLCGQLYCLGKMYPDLNVIVGGLLDLFVICIAIRMNTTTGTSVGDQTTTTTRYYISERVEDPRSYVILLMFNLFGLPLNDMKQLTADFEVPLEPMFPPVEYIEETLTDGGTNLNETLEENQCKPKRKRIKKSAKHEETKHDTWLFRDDDDHDDDKVTRVVRQRHTRSTSSTLCTQLQTTSSGKENKQQYKKQLNQKQHQSCRILTDSALEDQQEQVRELLEWDNRRLGLASLTANELNKRNAAAPFKPNLMF